MEPADLHTRVEAAFNAGDVPALVALYEPDACMLGDDGTVSTGLEAIGAIWGGYIAFGGRISLKTRYAVTVGDIALLSNAWTFEMDGAVAASSVTAEVARRQADGSWKYVIDNPDAGEPPRS